MQTTTAVTVRDVRAQLDRMEDQFKHALPQHMPVQRFKRVVLTALQNTPKLFQCDRQSLWNAAMRAAQDGLLPDGREGAIIPFQDKSGKDIAQWLPMIAGLRKKVLQSGEVATWECAIVYEQDEFEFQLGDAPFIHHKPSLAAERGPIIAAYSVATLKGSGEKSREVMSISDIEKIRHKSRAKGGPWSDPVFYPEMCKKVVAKRHAKVLPMSSDLERVFARDDAMFDTSPAPDRPKLEDFTEAEPEMDHAEAFRLGIVARERGDTIDAPLPGEVPDEFVDAWREGWRSADEEIRKIDDTHETNIDK